MIATLLVVLALWLWDSHISYRLGMPARASPITLPRRAPHYDPNALACDLDLFIACVHAGLSITHATAIVAESSSLSQWSHVARMLSMGVHPLRAWEELAEVDGLEEIAVLVRNSLRSGSALASGFERIAHTLRAQVEDHAVERAEKAGVLIALPLTCCFLPAFFVLGLAPVLITLGTTVFH
ncbi:type II secretion system protein F domain-containing protein [Corynebacterium kutscheri]|uniref:Type II secretion system protein F n=1 Tax=Corynebacterium kutscheri TaxID=35755 RepID=A0A0F6QYZ4_9CORY|nr:type II secretion system F family protein [Corynebacterium kutscheri]AKE40425.1 type II secretion system protein F [Corynebacterium kutscheri]VEH05229.1 type II secretion system protein F domain-containing protein [Corynebacterium kutscheri]VEH10820.1 type II secretion system protein F domain-containing protein [Corynebacterium kutscheri]VEH80701.1 type II secretion system protein F domain-containing protein [Corynebacterium kutscheri]